MSVPRARPLREPSLQILPPTPLGAGSAQAPQSTYIQTLTRQQIISAEFAGLTNEGHCPHGVYIVPSPNDPNLWHGVLFIHKGLYTGGIFKFTIMFPPHYPSVPPKLRFTSEVYHPLISDHGDFSLRPKGKWIPAETHITNILHYVKHSFKKKGLENLREAWCVNPDAFKLFRDKPDVFANQAHQCAILSTSSSMLYDTPGQEDEDSGLRFVKITKDEYNDVLAVVLGMWNRNVDGQHSSEA